MNQEDHKVNWLWRMLSCLVGGLLGLCLVLLSVVLVWRGLVLNGCGSLSLSIFLLIGCSVLLLGTSFLRMAYFIFRQSERKYLVRLWATILTLCGCALLAGSVWCVSEYLRPISSSGGTNSFGLERVNTNDLSKVFENIKERLAKDGFQVNEVSGLSTNDERLSIAVKRVSNASEIKVITVKRKTLSGWLTYWVKLPGPPPKGMGCCYDPYPEGTIHWHISGVNGGEISGRDYHAFHRFTMRLVKEYEPRAFHWWELL